MSRISLHAQKRAWPISCELEHLRRLRHGLGKLELAGIDALQLLVPTRSRGRAALRRSTEGLQMNILDSLRFESGPKRRFGEPRPARQGQRANVDQSLDTGGSKCADQLAYSRAFVADGEDSHLHSGW